MHKIHVLPTGPRILFFRTLFVCFKQIFSSGVCSWYETLFLSFLIFNFVLGVFVRVSLAAVKTVRWLIKQNL